MSARAFASLTLFALIVPACGGASSGGTADKPPSPPASASRNQINAMPRDKVQDGGKFTWALDSMPANFNYYELDGTPQDGYYVLAALMPTPYTNDAVGAPVWNRDYLASEPRLTTDPKQIVTYEINPKAVWYDGSPITWEDFYWQWKASNGLNKAYQISSSSGYEEIENVEKGKDDREVVVTYRQKYADWTSTFNPFYPASTNKDPKTFNEGWKDRPLTSAGAFRLDSIDMTSKTITFVRNEKWWGNRAKLDRIVYRVIEPDAQIDALANGEIDAMEIGSDANKFHRVQDIAGVEARVAGGPNFTHLTINATSPNLQDNTVRQALAMAIDRAAITRALLAPVGVEPRPLNNHIFMANQGGYKDNSGEVGKYDPSGAQHMLDEAGWKLEGNVRKKGGRSLEIVCVIPAGVAVGKQVAELVQNMLGQIGVSMSIQSVPVSDFFDKYVRPGQFDFTLFAWMGTSYPVSSSKSIYSMPRKNAKGELDVKQNYSRVGSEEIDRLYDQANQELDRTKATELANQIDALIWHEVHSLTLYQRPELIACKKNLANFGAFGFAAPWTYQDIGWAKTS